MALTDLEIDRLFCEGYYFVHDVAGMGEIVTPDSAQGCSIMHQSEDRSLNATLREVREKISEQPAAVRARYYGKFKVD